jgi:plastocyanin
MARSSTFHPNIFDRGTLVNKKNLLLVLVMIVAALGIAGCGDDGDDPTDDNPALSEQEDAQNQQTEPTESSDSGQKLALSADPNGDLKYTTDKLNANAGNITIALTNESSVPHDVAVEDSSGSEIGKSDEVTQANTDLALQDVDAGSYTFFCTLPGHKAAGMEGTLTVR